MQVVKGDITEQDVRSNISIAIQYIASWLSGNGCVPLYHLMEDAATAEISRSQVWQWLHHNAVMNDGKSIDLAIVNQFFTEEVQKIRARMDQEEFYKNHFPQASDLTYEIITNSSFTDFLTTKAYQLLP